MRLGGGHSGGGGAKQGLTRPKRGQVYAVHTFLTTPLHGLSLFCSGCQLTRPQAEGVDATVLHVAEEQGGMQANGAAGNGDSHASVENGSTKSSKGLGVFSMSAKIVHRLMRKPAAAPEAAPSGIDFADHAAFMRQVRLFLWNL